MITLDVVRHGLVVLDTDDSHARFQPTGCLIATRAATCLPAAGAVRSLVEVQRRFGGHSPWALLGAQFVAGDGDELVFEVGFGDGEPTGEGGYPSRLRKRPFLPGLPEEFAAAVLDGISAEGPLFPAGRVTVDRAGHDEIESSAFVFRQAAQALGCALAAGLRPDADLEAEVRGVVETW
jgi:hypothetical protein